MKNIIILLLLVCFYTDLKAKAIPARLISNRDTQRITLLVPIHSLYGVVNVEKLTQKPQFLDTVSNKPVALKPAAFKELRFNHKKREYRLVSMPNNMLYSDTSGGFTLLELKVDGRIRFYYHYEKRRESGNSRKNEKWVNGIQIKEIDPGTGDVVQENLKHAETVVRSPVVQIGDERPICFFKGSGRQWLLFCINDCKALMNLIARRKFKIKEHKLELTVAKYNELCGS